VNRIFLTLSILSNAALGVSFYLGWRIGDAAALSPDARTAVTQHFLSGLGAAILVLLVHAVALTYFMGTGRWIEETCAAYRLGPEPRRENIRLKYRALPGMVGCVLLVMGTAACGAMADPAANVAVPSAAAIHFTLAAVTLCANVLVSCVEHAAIDRNGKLVEAVLADVRRMRQERGLDRRDGA
jgi:hypothetical protein